VPGRFIIPLAFNKFLYAVEMPGRVKIGIRQLLDSRPVRQRQDPLTGRGSARRRQIADVQHRTVRPHDLRSITGNGFFRKRAVAVSDPFQFAPFNFVRVIQMPVDPGAVTIYRIDRVLAQPFFGFAALLRVHLKIHLCRYKFRGNRTRLLRQIDKSFYIPGFFAKIVPVGKLFRQ